MGNGDDRGISATEREVPPSTSTGCSSLTKERSRKRDSNTFENESSKSCNCKKSKCLKLYCNCFSYGQYCTEGCGCQDCYNRPDHEDNMVLGIRQQRKSFDPSASNRKIMKHATEARQNSGWQRQGLEKR
ncbi:hypothetical protein MRB53_008566 [Persea americana]|uniref:Uncharacterized protein n=1 Tax=Persea americana TaxID=3435 RepID=A0ACC2MMU5_PERAE|nr:hypothetical protein MRB53_008566 [Persea americana]